MPKYLDNTKFRTDGYYRFEDHSTVFGIRFFMGRDEKCYYHLVSGIDNDAVWNSLEEINKVMYKNRAEFFLTDSTHADICDGTFQICEDGTMIVDYFHGEKHIAVFQKK